MKLEGGMPIEPLMVTLMQSQHGENKECITHFPGFTLRLFKDQSNIIRDAQEPDAYKPKRE